MSKIQDGYFRTNLLAKNLKIDKITYSIIKSQILNDLLKIRNY